METGTLMDALVLCKRMGTLLNEVLDLSQQLAEAISRSDQVSVSMLVNMRREPIDKLVQTSQNLQTLADTLKPVEDALRLVELLSGAPALSPQEQQLSTQVASNQRRLKQVVELDQILNQKLGRDKSIYQ